MDFNNLLIFLEYSRSFGGFLFIAHSSLQSEIYSLLWICWKEYKGTVGGGKIGKGLRGSNGKENG